MLPARCGHAVFEREIPLLSFNTLLTSRAGRSKLQSSVELPPVSVERNADLVERDRLHSGQPVASSGAADVNRELVADESAAAAKEGNGNGTPCSFDSHASVRAKHSFAVRDFTGRFLDRSAGLER
jgi:hypothetical protein